MLTITTRLNSNYVVFGVCTTTPIHNNILNPSGKSILMIAITDRYYVDLIFSGVRLLYCALKYFLNTICALICLDSFVYSFKLFSIAIL